VNAVLDMSKLHTRRNFCSHGDQSLEIEEEEEEEDNSN
jgi:hypothetical protein